MLHLIHNFLKEHLPSNINIIADLPDTSPYVFPPHIAKTDLRPDIVVWSDRARSVSLLELMVCHESNFVDAHQRKATRYLELEDQIRHAHFWVKTIPIQVGCRGFIDISSFEEIKEMVCSVSITTWRKFL